MSTVIRKLIAVALLSITGLVAAGCPTKLSTDSPDIDVKTDLKAQALTILRALFPDLSDEELSAIAVDLDLSAIVALRSELEAIRKKAVEFSRDLFKTAQGRVEDRKTELEPLNDGFPEGVAALGQVCTLNRAEGRAEVRLSGVFNGKAAVQLSAEQLQLSVDGAEQSFSLDCLAGGTSVDVVFLIDITGSMSNVIASVRNSVVNFVDHLEASGVQGTVSVVTFQDSVGVNRSFQEPAPERGYERSPFFTPVALDDASAVDELRAFVNRLEANRGADAPENLAGAIDFARNSVIGYEASGAPNVIGDGKQDPVGTAPFPELESARQVFVVLTDVAFHGDGHDASNSSLLEPFVPRDAADILATLQQTGTTVHVSDPSWADASMDPASPTVDADYWAHETGGLGEDITAGYSLLDLELVVVAEDSGLLDITLDQVISTSCTLRFDAQISAEASVEVDVALNVEGETSTQRLACSTL